MLFLSFILNLLATLCRRLEGINTVPLCHHLEFFNASVGTYLFSRSTNPDSHGDFAVL